MWGQNYSNRQLLLKAGRREIAILSTTSDFDNRIFFLGPTTTAGSSYLIPGGGVYLNAGGIDTSGVEFSATVQMPGRTYCESLNV